MGKKKLTGLEVNEDGQTALYELCSMVYMTSKSGTQEVRDLIDSYPEEIREKIVNKKVETPARAKRFENNPSVSLKEYDIGDTPLHVAVRNEAPFVTKKLLESGANPNAINGEGFTALDEAIQYKNFEIAKLLIDSGAKVNITDKNMDTPLMLAQDVMQEDPSNKDIKKIVNLIIKTNKKEVSAEKYTEFVEQASELIGQASNFGKRLFSFNFSNSPKTSEPKDSASLSSKKSSGSISSSADTELDMNRMSPLTVDSENSRNTSPITAGREAPSRIRKEIPMFNPGAATQSAVNRPDSTATVVESYQSASSMSTGEKTRSGNRRGASPQADPEILKPLPKPAKATHEPNAASTTPSLKKPNKLVR
jgi:hypothetical protein